LEKLFEEKVENMFDPKRRRIYSYYYYDSEEELQRKGIKIAVYLIIIGVCISTIQGIASTIGIFIPLITALVYKGRTKRFQWQQRYGKFKYVLIAAIVITAIELFFLSRSSKIAF
jgi:hypothetical protein